MTSSRSASSVEDYPAELTKRGFVPHMFPLFRRLTIAHYQVLAKLPTEIIHELIRIDDQVLSEGSTVTFTSILEIDDVAGEVLDAVRAGLPAVMRILRYHYQIWGDGPAGSLEQDAPVGAQPELAGGGQPDGGHGDGDGAIGVPMTEEEFLSTIVFEADDAAPSLLENALQHTTVGIDVVAATGGRIWESHDPRHADPGLTLAALVQWGLPRDVIMVGVEMLRTGIPLSASSPIDVHAAAGSEFTVGPGGERVTPGAAKPSVQGDGFFAVQQKVKVPQGHLGGSDLGLVNKARRGFSFFLKGVKHVNQAVAGGMNSDGSVRADWAGSGDMVYLDHFVVYFIHNALQFFPDAPSAAIATMAAKRWLVQHPKGRLLLQLCVPNIMWRATVDAVKMDPAAPVSVSGFAIPTDAPVMAMAKQLAYVTQRVLGETPDERLNVHAPMGGNGGQGGRGRGRGRGGRGRGARGGRGGVPSSDDPRVGQTRRAETALPGHPRMTNFYRGAGGSSHGAGGASTSGYGGR